MEFNAFRAPALTHLTENCCLSVFLIKATGHRVMNVLLSQEYSDGTKYSQVTLREKCYVLIKACTEAEKKIGEPKFNRGAGHFIVIHLEHLLFCDIVLKSRSPRM